MTTYAVLMAGLLLTADGPPREIGRVDPVPDLLVSGLQDRDPDDLLPKRPPGRIRAQEPFGISGKWSGMGVNSDGNKGTASLLVEEHQDGTLTGKWGAAGSEMTIENGERVTAQVLHWECSTGIYRYRVRCTMEGQALVITYTLTWTEEGKVNGHTGTGVLVRE
jgi:hypothetical protein